MFRFSNPFPRLGPARPAHTIARDGIRLTITEYPKACGHPGYLAEVFLALGAEGGLSQAALLPAEDLQSTVALLQEAMAFVNDRGAMPRCLQTVYLRGATYFVDGRLGELRREDDPPDRVPIAL